jgi:hypothetical protein
LLDLFLFDFQFLLDLRRRVCGLLCCPRAAPTTKENRAAARTVAQERVPGSVGLPAFILSPNWRQEAIGSFRKKKIFRSCFKVNIGHDSSTTDSTGAPIL